MSNRYAEEKFREAVTAFSGLARNLWKPGGGDASQSDFRDVLTDLEAAIPGLDGVMRGRALVLKGECHFNIFWKTLGLTAFYDPDRAPTSPPTEALECALEGQRILQAEHSTSDLQWADSVVQKLRDSGSA